jgi:ubiquinone/menaquinone biosynthesis C-methylase UbiE
MGFKNPGRFDILTDRLSAHYLFRRYYSKFTRRLRIAGSERVLDFGSGSGALSRHIAKSLRKGGGGLVCLDTSHPLLNEARRHLRKYDHVEYVSDEIFEYARSAPRFDIIVVHFTLHDIQKDRRPEVVKSLSQVLAPDGRLCICEPTRKDHGMPVVEIRGLMSAAGLKEIEHGYGRAYFTYPTYTGLYVKSE